MTAAVDDPPAETLIESDWVTPVAAAKLVGRTVDEFVALEGQRSFRRGFPKRQRIGRGYYYDRGTVLAWGVDVGCITPAGDVLVGYDDIARLLAVSPATVKDWERTRKENDRIHGAPDDDDLPDPYGTFWVPTSPRPMWPRDEIVRWAVKTRRMTVDGDPQELKTGRWKRVYQPRE